MGSRIHREVYVRFRGEDSETCCCEAVRRRILSLQCHFAGFFCGKAIYYAFQKYVSGYYCPEPDSVEKEVSEV